jgi:CRP-like cAMP-binding protein
MTAATPTIYDFLATTAPFDCLAQAALEKLAKTVQPMRYEMGQAIVVREKLPAQIAILYDGQARSLGYASASGIPETLERLRPGSIIGWIGLIRGVACETAIASVESICLMISARDFRSLLTQEADFAQALTQQVSLIELYELLSAELSRRALGEANLKHLAQTLLPDAIVLTLNKGETRFDQLDQNLLWLLSGGTTNVETGSRLSFDDAQTLSVSSPTARLIGLRHFTASTEPTPTAQDGAGQGASSLQNRLRF